MDTKIIGIVAGGGQFPFMVARGARDAGFGVVATGYVGHTDESLSQEVDCWKLFHLGQLNSVIGFFHKQQVTEVVFAGAINKPRAIDIRPDFRALKVLLKARSKGDDVLLRAIAAEFEAENLPVVSALSLTPDIATPAGPLTSRAPRSHEWEDLRYAWPKAKAIGAMDIGQSIVVKSGIVIAVEGPEGTDATLRRAGELAGKGCVLCKVYKPGQDDRIDLPAIGRSTIETMLATGATCLGIEAGKSIFFDQHESIALAEKHGIRLAGLTDELIQQ